MTSAVARLTVEPRPALRVQMAGSDVTVCWPDSETHYVLEESESPSGGWAEVAAAPMVENSTHCVAVPVRASSRFYRLRGSPAGE